MLLTSRPVPSPGMLTVAPDVEVLPLDELPVLDEVDEVPDSALSSELSEEELEVLEVVVMVGRPSKKGGNANHPEVFHSFRLAAKAAALAYHRLWLAGPDGVVRDRLASSGLLLQQLEDLLRLRVGGGQHRDAGLLQHVGLAQIRRLCSEVRILDRRLGAGQIV